MRDLERAPTGARAEGDEPRRGGPAADARPGRASTPDPGPAGGPAAREARPARAADGSGSAERVLGIFLRAVMAARRSLGLYPAGSEMAASWVHRLHRALEELFEQGLCFPVRIERDRFAWAGQDLVSADPALEAFRFDLEIRGIREIDIDPAVRDWELQVFLELLNTAGAELGQLGGASAFLAGHGVTGIRVVAPGDAGPDRADEVYREALRTGRDAVEVFVDTLVELVEARLADLAYDRTGLTVWLGDVAAGDAGRLYETVRMLHGMAEQTADREVRTRTVVEALLALPESILRPFFADHLVPLAGRDVLALNLFSQLTEDELRDVAQRLVPQDALLALSSELLEFPWEEAKRRRLVEAITSAVRPATADELAEWPGAVPAADEAVLAEVRDEIVAACQPDALLERAAEILLALVLSPESEEYGSSTLDAIEEIVGEALARDRLDLAVRILSTLVSSVHVGGVRVREHARQVGLLQQRMAGRTYVSLVAGLLRQHGSGDQHLALAAEYLQLLPRDAIQEFTTVLGEERDRQVRARMCQVLAKVGAPAVPVLLGWLEDPRWYVARNMVHVLGKIGDPAAFEPIGPLLGHAHPRVRIETARVLAVLAPDRAAGLIVPLLGDADPLVRVESVRALGGLRGDEAVSALLEVAGRRTDARADFALRSEAIGALAAIGSPAARAALEGLASRRAWPWQRLERRLRRLAGAALAPPTEPVEVEDE